MARPDRLLAPVTHPSSAKTGPRDIHLLFPKVGILRSGRRARLVRPADGYQKPEQNGRYDQSDGSSDPTFVVLQSLRWGFRSKWRRGCDQRRWLWWGAFFCRWPVVVMVPPATTATSGVSA
jgi:hypothetical protein